MTFSPPTLSQNNQISSVSPPHPHLDHTPGETALPSLTSFQRPPSKARLRLLVLQKASQKILSFCSAPSSTAPRDGKNFSDLLLVSGDFLCVGTQCKLPQGAGWHQEAPNALSVPDSLGTSWLSVVYALLRWEVVEIAAAGVAAWFQLFALLPRNHHPQVQYPVSS